MKISRVAEISLLLGLFSFIIYLAVNSLDAEDVSLIFPCIGAIAGIGGLFVGLFALLRKSTELIAYIGIGLSFVGLINIILALDVIFRALSYIN